MKLHTRSPLALLLVAGTSMTAGMTSQAQGAAPFTVIVQRFKDVGGVSTAELVPGLPVGQAGMGVVWNNPQFASPGLSVVPSIDAAGNVAFFGVANTTSVVDGDGNVVPIINSTNQQMVFHSSAASGYAFNSIEIVARDGSATGVPAGGPTPSNPNNWVLNNTSATAGAGLGAGVGMSSNGRMLITGQMRGAGAVSNSNNAAFFTGFKNSLAETARRSDAAAGIADAFYNTNLNFSPINNQVNPSGQVVFASALSGTGTTSGVNDSATFIEGPAGASLVARRGDSPTFLGGAVFGAMTTNPGSNTINKFGDVLFTNTLSTTAGATPATTSNDAVIVAKVGGTLSLVAREAGSVTVNGNAENYASASNFGLASLGQTFNNSGRALFGAKLATSANVTLNTNDTVLQTWAGGATTTVAQTGVTMAPHSSGSATLATMGVTSNSQSRINNNNRFTLSGALAQGGSISSSNDDGLWLGDATGGNPLALIAHEGMAAPGSGANFGSGFFGVAMNNADTVLFQNTLSDGRSSLWGWNQAWGLRLITYAGDTRVFGASYPISGFNFLATGNGDGGIYGFNDNNVLSFFASASGTQGALSNNGAVVVVYVPTPAAASLLGLSGLVLMARRRRA